MLKKTHNIYTPLSELQPNKRRTGPRLVYSKKATQTEKFKLCSNNPLITQKEFKKSKKVKNKKK
jgi:hypothetical protein